MSDPVERLADAIQRLTLKFGVCRLDVDFPLAVAVIAHLQLALRHPGTTSETSDEVEHFVREWIDRIRHHEPEAAALLDMGWRAEHDVPAQNGGG